MNGGCPLRVLLLNPPGRRRYVRDNYCSYTSKTGELWAPQDLLFQAAWLAERHRVEVVDAIATDLAPAACMRAIQRFAPQVIFSLVGSASLAEDLAFLRAAKARSGAQLYLSGDLLLAGGDAFLDRHRFVDGLVLDFTSPALVRHLDGDGAAARSGSLLLRGCPLAVPAAAAPRAEAVRVPRPRHELFPLRRYRMALLGGAPVAATMTSLGCPLSCPFCVNSLLPLRLRPVSDLFAELDWLLRATPVRSVYFHDPLLTSSRGRVRELCATFMTLAPRFGWACNGIVSGLDRELLHTMAQAGCRAIMLGLETEDDRRRAELGKRFSTARAREVIEGCRQEGILTLGYFLLGLPCEDEAQMRRTTRFAVSSGVDYASFNLVAPPPGAAMGERPGRLARSVDHTFHSSLEHPSLAPRRIDRLRREAYLRFYLRPRFLARQLLSRRRGTLLSLARSGLVLLAQQLLAR